MPRPKLIRTKTLPYHVRARANNREWFYLPQERCWKLMGQTLDIASILYHAHIHAFVLMGNHFHLIVSTPEGNLDRFMQYFMREASKAIGRDTGRINRIFGARYQRSVLDSEVYFLNALRYVYRNPVEAALCKRVEEYPFSTLRVTLSRRAELFSISEEPVFLFRLVPKGEALCRWLNTPYAPEQRDIIRKALRRGACRWTKEARKTDLVLSLSQLPIDPENLAKK